MNWNKLGKIFEFQSINDDLLTHASNPLAIHLTGDIYRVFFSGRDKDNKSSVGYVDIDIELRRILSVCDEATFKVSNEYGAFFSHGISVGNCYRNNDKNYILFMAWQIPNNGHWRGDIGRLELSDDLSDLSLVGDRPFLSVDKEDRVSLSYPWVMLDEGIYKMWYGSTVEWNSSNGEMIHVIKYATSEDGERWSRHGLAIPYELGVAQAFSRPTVVKDDNGYHMWFSYRSGDGAKYRIGYAHSFDSLEWDRKEKSGIDVSAGGWDSEMICYPFVFDHKGKRYMLYNGNDYGKTGFGLAILEGE
jgi:hypothetical protein